jgi:hypothetical protein
LRPLKSPNPSLARRLLWFAALWIAGVAALALAGLLLRILMRAL